MPVNCSCARLAKRNWIWEYWINFDITYPSVTLIVWMIAVSGNKGQCKQGVTPEFCWNHSGMPSVGVWHGTIQRGKQNRCEARVLLLGDQNMCNCMSFHVNWVGLNQRYFYWLVREQHVIPCTFDGVLPSIGVEVDENLSRLETLRKAFMINHPSDYGCHHGNCRWPQGS